MNLLIPFINSLQIVIHLPLLNTLLPGNVVMFFQFLYPIVTFDVLQPEWSTELIFEFDEEMQEELEDTRSDQISDLGYESHNSVLNLGSIGVALCLYILQLFIVFILLKPFTDKETVNELYSSRKDKLIFGDLLTISLEGYMELLISGILNLEAYRYTTGGEVAGLILSRISLGLTLVVLPVLLIWILFTKQEKIEDEEFKARWGSLYHEVSHRSKMALAFFSVFVVRRFVYILSAFTWQSVPSQ